MPYRQSPRPFPAWSIRTAIWIFPIRREMAEIREEMRANGVTHALCISVNLAGFPKVWISPRATIISCNRRRAPGP